jgi:DNA-binding transcriptional regulator LsrR (DeoR family)
MNKERYYVQIPVQAFTDTRLTRAAICVYAVLIAAADKFCKVEGLTIEQIAQRCCIGEKTVRRAEAQLCSTGYIKIEPTGRGSIIWVTHDLRPQAFDVFAAYEAAAAEEQHEAWKEAHGL